MDYTPIQASYRSDPWRVLVACLLLNLTDREQVRVVIDGFFDRWPSAQSLAAADIAEVETALRHTGLSSQKASRLCRMSQDFLRAEVLSHSIIQTFTGCGRYTADAFAIFCQGETDVRPTDRVLADYVKEAHRLHERGR